MSGEKNDLRAPQPGGRGPAPGALALVQSFVNTHFDLAGDGGERLSDPAATPAWLAGHNLIDRDIDLDEHDLARALALREGLRALALANNEQTLDPSAIEAMHRASAGTASEIRVDQDGPRFLAPPDSGIEGAIGSLLAITARAMIDGSWPRLKTCPGRRCGWAFYDHSRNRSARWCSMKVCGDREKARAYYRRNKLADRERSSS